MTGQGHAIHRSRAAASGIYRKDRQHHVQKGSSADHRAGASAPQPGGKSVPDQGDRRRHVGSAHQPGAGLRDPLRAAVLRGDAVHRHHHGACAAPPDEAAAAGCHRSQAAGAHQRRNAPVGGSSRSPDLRGCVPHHQLRLCGAAGGRGEPCPCLRGAGLRQAGHRRTLQRGKRDGRPRGLHGGGAYQHVPDPPADEVPGAGAAAVRHGGKEPDGSVPMLHVRPGISPAAMCAPSWSAGTGGSSTPPAQRSGRTCFAPSCWRDGWRC